MTLFCDGCNHLDLTENEQQEVGNKYYDHNCTFYKKRVKHQGFHPQIVRLKECKEYILNAARQ